MKIAYNSAYVRIEMLNFTFAQQAFIANKAMIHIRLCPAMLFPGESLASPVPGQ